MGEPRLREAIAARYGGADEPSSRVIITHGAVEGLNLTFAAAAGETGGRRVAIESPGYFMLAPILEGLNLEAVPAPRGPSDAWMRVNISRCEGTLLTRARRVLDVAAGRAGGSGRPPGPPAS